MSHGRVTLVGLCSTRLCIIAACLVVLPAIHLVAVWTGQILAGRKKVPLKKLFIRLRLHARACWPTRLDCL